MCAGVPFKCGVACVAGLRLICSQVFVFVIFRGYGLSRVSLINPAYSRQIVTKVSKTECHENTSNGADGQVTKQIVVSWNSANAPERRNAMAEVATSVITVMRPLYYK